MSSLTDLIQLIESFEKYLGNPKDKSTPLNFIQSLQFDEQEQLPQEQITFIQQWGYMDYFIPASLGGKIPSLMPCYLLAKAVSRRDLTTSIALGLTFLASTPTWIAGSDKQQQNLAQRIQRGHIGSLALTEEAHGSDLTANEMAATPHQDGWLISGQKWCVNYATLAKTSTILCRTNPLGGLLGFSLFFIDKDQIKSGLTHLPKLLTHGVRGLDISGFSLENVWLPNEAMIGKKNQGLGITYKALQITRTLCANLSVGSADTALRLAVSFSLQRHLYGHPAYDIPAVKQRLGECFTYLLIADCTALAMIRACSVVPERMSFWSAIIKFLIPKIAEEIVEQCAIVIGARAFLRTAEWAIFQKIRRDNDVVGLFDGSSQVNLFVIAGNLLPQSKMRNETNPDTQEKLNQLFNLAATIPHFSVDNFGTYNQGQDEIIAGIIKLNSAKITSLITLIHQQIKILDQEVLSLHEQGKFDARGLEAFRLAEKYCWIFAASCTLMSWFYNQDNLIPKLKELDWLTLAIQLILTKLNTSTTPIDPHLQNTMGDCLVDFFMNKQSFSSLPITIMD